MPADHWHGEGKCVTSIVRSVEATEEAIVSATVAAQDMTGAADHRVIALPHSALRAVLKKYNRLAS